MPVSQHTAQAHQRPGDRPGNSSVVVLKRSLPRISFAIRTCSHRVPPIGVNSRVRRLSRPSFAFPCQDGSPSYLATAYLLDVGSLSGPATRPGQILNRYPTRYRLAFASSNILSSTPLGVPYGLLAGADRQKPTGTILAFLLLFAIWARRGNSQGTDDQASVDPLSKPSAKISARSRR